MGLETLIIIEENYEFGKTIRNYCEQYFTFKTIHIFENFSDILCSQVGKTFIMVNSTQLKNTDELILMSQLIRKHASPIILYSDFNGPEINHIIDAIELGALDVIPAKLFQQKNIIRSECAIFNRMVETLQKGTFSFDINLLRKRLYPAQLEKSFNTQKKKSITVVGCDIGGISSMLGFIPQLPSTYPSPVCLLMNGSQKILNALGDRLQINSSLKVQVVTQETVIKNSIVYIISANQTPVLDFDNNGEVKILVNNSLPFDISLKHWIDPFMFNAAEIYEKNTIGILLGGVQEDGIMGLNKINKMHGTTIIQSKQSCFLPDRLKMAQEQDCVQHSVYIGELADTLLTLI